MSRPEDTVDAYDVKTRLSGLVDKVEQGQEIVITKHGAAVARLVPVKKQASEQGRLAAIERIQILAAGLTLGGLKLKDLIAEGHAR